MKAYHFLMGNLFFNLGFVVVTWAGVWGDSFGTWFYDTYFSNITSVALVGGTGVIVLLVAAATFSFIFPSGTKGVAYGLFASFYWLMWGNTILIFSRFATILGDVGMQMLGIITVIVVILFIVGITQCELGGFASHE